MSFTRVNNLKPSSMIHELHYDPENQILRTKFNNGEIGDYYDVPSEVVAQLRTAQSLGSAFHRLVKNGGYRYESVGVD
jgi:hypothetical protein